MSTTDAPEIDLDIDWNAAPSKAPVRGPKLPMRPAAPVFATPDAEEWWPHRRWRHADGTREDFGPVYGPISPAVLSIAELAHSMAQWGAAATAHAADVQRIAAELAAQRDAELAAAQAGIATSPASAPVLPPIPAVPVALQANVTWCTCPIGTRGGLEFVNGSRLCTTCHKPRVVRPLASRGAAQNANARATEATARVLDNPDTAALPVITAASAADTYLKAPRRGTITRDNVIAGARSEASGVLVGWAGLGELSRAQIEAALVASGLPGEWAPASKSARAQAGRAVMSLASVGVVPRAEVSRRGTPSTSQRTPTNRSGREYDARWTVGIVDHGSDVGDSFGSTALTVTLRGENITLDGDSKLAERVSTEYNRTLGAELYPAGDVTDWLRSTLVRRMGAIRLGGNYYVPFRNVDSAERLCAALAHGGDNRPRWGVDWILPALPVSTTEQLRAGLTTGLVAEAEAVLDDLRARRSEAKAQGRSEIGERAATSLLRRLVDVSERAKAYHEILGDERTGEVIKAITAAVAAIEPLVSDTAQRGAMLDMYTAEEWKAAQS